jgi:hypothetical protein
VVEESVSPDGPKVVGAAPGDCGQGHRSVAREGRPAQAVEWKIRPSECQDGGYPDGAGNILCNAGRCTMRAGSGEPCDPRVDKQPCSRWSYCRTTSSVETMRYAHLDQKHLRAGVDTMGADGRGLPLAYTLAYKAMVRSCKLTCARRTVRNQREKLAGWTGLENKLRVKSIPRLNAPLRFNHRFTRNFLVPSSSVVSRSIPLDSATFGPHLGTGF